MPSIFNDPRPELRRSLDFGEWLGVKVMDAISWGARHVAVISVLAVVGGGMLLYGFFYGMTNRQKRP